MATNVFDNIDWKKRALGTTETHHTNSILIQKYESAENLSNVSLGADYNFERKNHWSCKGSTPVLSNFCLKRGSAKRLKYSALKNREKCIKSSSYSLVWAHTQIIKGKQRVPSCSEFYELVSKSNLDQITVGYLPSLPFSPTETQVIAAKINECRIPERA